MKQKLPEYEIIIQHRTAIGLLIVLSLLNWYGIKESARFTVFATIIESLGLLIVIAIGLFFIGSADIDYFALPGGISGILSATALLFFAYIGFEDLVNMSEETKDAAKTIPKALVIAIAVSTILYILVSISSVAVLGSFALGQSKAPLTAVVAKVIPQAGILMSIIALFATANTALALLVVGSRMLYGLACNGAFPAFLGKVGSRNTPYASIIVVAVVALIVMSLTGIKSVALMTDIGIFTAYIFVNASVILLRYKMPKAKRTFKSPLNIGKFPLLAFFGLLTSIAMLFHFEAKLLLYEAAVVAIGYAIFLIFKRASKNQNVCIPLFKKSVYTIDKNEITNVRKYPAMIVKIMTKKIIYVKPTDRVSVALELMDKNNIGSVVVGNIGKAIGIITERDIVKKVAGRDSTKTRCKEVMSSPVITISSSASVASAIDAMNTKKIKKLVVLHGKRVVGIVSYSDLMSSGMAFIAKHTNN